MFPEWTEEEIEDIETAGGVGGTRAAATRAVQLIAARAEAGRVTLLTGLASLDWLRSKWAGLPAYDDVNACAAKIEALSAQIELLRVESAARLTFADAWKTRAECMESERDDFAKERRNFAGINENWARQLAEAQKEIACLSELCAERLRFAEKLEGEKERQRMFAEARGDELIKCDNMIKMQLQRIGEWKGRANTAECRLAQLRDLVGQLGALGVEMAKRIGEPENKEMRQCDHAKIQVYEEGKWECQQCGFTRYPCCGTCTHDDARTPGHPERVKARGEAVQEALDPLPKLGLYSPAETKAWETGAEALRAACREAVCVVLTREGLWTRNMQQMIDIAIEGATP